MIRNRFKYNAKDVQNEVLDSFWSYLGPSCTNSPLSPQKLQTEEHCVGPEAIKTGFLSTQNDHCKKMHFENHVFCAERTAEN